jgi:DnaJ-class molecular chaperone
MASKNHPDDVACGTCGGTGYQSAAKEMGMEDMPMMMKPIGVWPCNSCQGSGLLIDGEKMAKMTDYLEEHAELIQESMAALRAKRNG